MERSFDTTTVGLASGERVALCCLEIDAVPHAAVLGASGEAPQEAIRASARETVALLSEVFQTWRLDCHGAPEELALELLWVTHPVCGQAYAAAIRLFVVARALAPADAAARAAAARLLGAVAAHLSSRSYTWRPCAHPELENALGGVPDESVVAVVKQGRVENLQNPVVPLCYGFDRLAETESDLAHIVDALSMHPGCALSVQLMPAYLVPEESASLDRMVQSLGQLAHGVSNRGVGNMSYALATLPIDAYRYYAERKSAPLFAYNVLAYGAHADTAALAGRVAGHLASGAGDAVQVRTIRLDPRDVGRRENAYALPWAVNDLIGAMLWREVAYANPDLAPLARVPLMVSPEEAAELFRLPIGSDRVASGFKVSESSHSRRTFAAGVVNAGDLSFGRLSGSPGDRLGFSCADLAKHMLVVGTPGSGKSTFTIGTLDRLWREHGIPFLVIEPAKNEYRSLLATIPDLQVFTPGKSHISPLALNPFLPPRGVRVETYKSTLKTAFEAGASMTSPLDKVFEDALSTCYSDFHWLDTSVAEDGCRVFNIQDFITCFRRTVRSIGYTGDAANIGRAGEVRLQSLSRLFDTYHSVPVEDLLSKPTVIELTAVENADEKALIIALILLQVLAYINANYEGEGGLRNVIVLEEAHVLLGAGAGSGDAKPAMVAQSLLQRMLAEIRSYGVGMVIADQSPRRVGSDVMALTDIKMAFRLVEGEDRRILGDSSNMGPAQVSRLGRLQPGEAFAFFSRLEEPEEVIAPDYRRELGLSITLSDDELARRVTYWKDRPKLLRPYPECELCSCCRGGCDLARRVLARDVSRRVFARAFKRVDSTIEPLRDALARISRLVAAELDGAPLTPEFLLCAKVHLWRRVRYETRIPVTDKMIEQSLRR